MPADRERLRVGIAGLGFGVEVHLAALRAMPGVEIAALVGRNPARCSRVAEQTGLPVLTNVEEWLAQGLDAVTIAVPPCEVEEVVCKAAGRGLAVLAEKPLGCSLAAAKRIVASASTTNVVDFQFADLLTFQRLRDAIGAGEIGRLRHVAVDWLTESYAQRSGAWSWKTNVDEGGGALALLGSHVLYLAEWLFGPARRVLARFDTSATRRFAPLDGGSPAEDLIHMIMELDVPLAAVVGNANPGLSMHRWRVVGDHGFAVLENNKRGYMAGFVLNLFARDGSLVSTLTEPATTGDGRIPPFRRLAERFVDAARRGAPCRPDFSDGARGLLLADALRRSAASAAWLDVEPR